MGGTTVTGVEWVGGTTVTGGGVGGPSRAQSAVLYKHEVWGVGMSCSVRMYGCECGSLGYGACVLFLWTHYEYYVPTRRQIVCNWILI